MVKRLIPLCVLLSGTVAVCAAESASVEPSGPDFLSGFMSFGGLATVVVPVVVGFIASRLKKPMNRWVTLWVTALAGVAATLFSWWMGLGFPPAEASVWVALIDALFVALASAGIVSAGTSEWLARLFSGKVKSE